MKAQEHVPQTTEEVCQWSDGQLDCGSGREPQCEQGQNWNMIISQLVLLMLAAGSTWNLDGARGIFGD